MRVQTCAGISVRPELVSNYFNALVDHFFKILPMREEGVSSLPMYIRSLQIELFGCQSFILPMSTNGDYLSLLSILQYFIDHPDTDISDVKREVFRAISICKKLKGLYCCDEVTQ